MCGIGVTSLMFRTSIPAEASEIHGLTDAGVADAPHFAQIARSLADLLEGCDFAGFGIARFDLPILQAEFRRAGVEFTPSRNVVDTLTIFQRKEPHTLANAVKRYTGTELDPSSSVDAMRAVLEAQVNTYDGLQPDVAALSTFCRPPDWIDSEGKLRWVDGVPTIYYGRQYRGRSLAEVARLDPGHLDWGIERSNFSAEVKQILREARAGRFPSPPEDHDDKSP